MINEDAVVHAHAEQDGREAHADDVQRAKAHARHDHPGEQRESLEKEDPAERPQGAVENPEHAADEQRSHAHHHRHVAAHLLRNLRGERRPAGKEQALFSRQSLLQCGAQRSGESDAFLESRERLHGAHEQKGRRFAREQRGHRGGWRGARVFPGWAASDCLDDPERIDLHPRGIRGVQCAAEFARHFREARAHPLRRQRADRAGKVFRRQIPHRPRGDLRPALRDFLPCPGHRCHARHRRECGPRGAKSLGAFVLGHRRIGDHDDLPLAGKVPLKSVQRAHARQLRRQKREQFRIQPQGHPRPHSADQQQPR